ncbi:MAG: phosphate transport system regulatory protein PhoU [Eubacteriales Family XIII. Incertae Sedis bacterium]|nr:MAG: phosphate transport system regulatory protein PhoU [Clostridiales Family XIII bacterium]
MRNKFEEDLAVLNAELEKMGKLCEEAIAAAVAALILRDTDFAEKAEEKDAEIDRMEREIEHLCMKLLLRQQPVARDLRVISAALKMISDMERIGDQASDIAEIVKRSVEKSAALYENPSKIYEKPSAEHENPEARYEKLEGGESLAEYEAETDRIASGIHIKDMAEAAIKMVNGSVASFIAKDVELAKNVMLQDDIVDGLFEKVKKEIMLLIKSSDVSSERGLNLLMIAKYLERIGDHAVNIAEWVEYSLTGRHKKDDPERQKAASFF